MKPMKPMKRWLSLTLCLLLLLAAAPWGSPAAWAEELIPNNPFADVDANSYYSDAVLWAVRAEITSGSAEGLFSPKKICTRAEALTFLWVANGRPEPERGDSPFTDVGEKDYFRKAVLWAYENGITSGSSENRFSPKKTCTRAQVVTFLWKAAGAPDPISPTGRALDIYWDGDMRFNVFNRSGQALYQAEELGMEEMPWWDEAWFVPEGSALRVPDDGWVRLDMRWAAYASAAGRDFSASLHEHEGVDAMTVSQERAVTLHGGQMRFRLRFPVEQNPDYPFPEEAQMYMTLIGNGAGEFRVAMDGENRIGLSGVQNEMIAALRADNQELVRLRLYDLPEECWLRIGDCSDWEQALRIQDAAGQEIEGVGVARLEPNEP